MCDAPLRLVPPHAGVINKPDLVCGTNAECTEWYYPGNVPAIIQGSNHVTGATAFLRDTFFIHSQGYSGIKWNRKKIYAYF